MYIWYLALMLARSRFALRKCLKNPSAEQNTDEQNTVYRIRIHSNSNNIVFYSEWNSYSKKCEITQKLGLCCANQYQIWNQRPSIT